MKRIACACFLFAVAIFFASAPSQSTSAAGTEGPRREKATVEFNETVSCNGVLLRGEYVIVHDEERMAKGEACSYIYRSKNGREGELVTSFHCQHADRAMANRFTMRILRRPGAYEVPELQEFQFAGSTAAHRVPGA